MSAVGDVAQVATIAHTIKCYSPQTKLTWIIGETEHQLLDHLTDIEFIIFNKRQPLKSCIALAKKLAHRRFNALLLMQYSLRAGLLSLLVKAPVRIGYPPELSRELHSLFINRSITTSLRAHKLDAYLSFAEVLGINDVTLKHPPYYLAEDAEFAQRHLSKDKKILVIAPCASRSFKNWPAARYAEVAEAVITQYNMQVVLTGTNSRTERLYEHQIQQQLDGQCLSLIGKTTLKQFAAVIAHSNAVLAPDSAAVHLASALKIPIIGLYAATNPARVGPYWNRDWCINRYPNALQKQWGKQIKRGRIMELISVAEVVEMLKRVISTTTTETPSF